MPRVVVLSAASGRPAGKHPEAMGKRNSRSGWKEFFRKKKPTRNLISSYAMSIFQDFRPMFMGQEEIPEDEITLISWLDDSENFRHRSAALINTG